MPVEMDDLDVAFATSFIADDEAPPGQLAEKRIHIHLVIGKDLGLDFFRSVFQSPGPVGKPPQADEQQPSGEAQLGQGVIFKKSRFDIARSHAFPTSNPVVVGRVRLSGHPPPAVFVPQRQTARSHAEIAGAVRLSSR